MKNAKKEADAAYVHAGTNVKLAGACRRHLNRIFKSCRETRMDEDDHLRGSYGAAEPWQPQKEIA